MPEPIKYNSAVLAAAVGFHGGDHARARELLEHVHEQLDVALEELDELDAAADTAVLEVD